MPRERTHISEEDNFDFANIDIGPGPPPPLATDQPQPLAVVDTTNVSYYNERFIFKGILPKLSRDSDEEDYYAPAAEGEIVEYNDEDDGRGDDCGEIMHNRRRKRPRVSRPDPNGYCFLCHHAYNRQEKERFVEYKYLLMFMEENYGVMDDQKLFTWCKLYYDSEIRHLMVPYGEEWTTVVIELHCLEHDPTPAIRDAFIMRVAWRQLMQSEKEMMQFDRDENNPGCARMNREAMRDFWYIEGKMKDVAKRADARRKR